LTSAEDDRQAVFAAADDRDRIADPGRRIEIIMVLPKK
jgi:hypothetical protein